MGHCVNASTCKFFLVYLLTTKNRNYKLNKSLALLLFQAIWAQAICQTLVFNQFLGSLGFTCFGNQYFFCLLVILSS